MAHTQTTKKPVEDYFEGTAWTEKTYTSDMSGLHVINDTVAVSVKVTAAGFTMTLAPTKELNEDFYPFDNIIIEPADGTKQVETIAVTAGATAAGTLVFTVTAAGMSNSPKAVNVDVTTDDNTAAEVAGKIRTALAADSDVSAFLTVSGTVANIVLTARAAAANDVTMAMALTDADSTGVTVGASTNTTAGVAPSAISFRAWVRG